MFYYKVTLKKQAYQINECKTLVPNLNISVTASDKEGGMVVMYKDNIYIYI